MKNHNNQCTVTGRVLTECKFSHEILGENFYSFFLETRRKSGIVDKIPVIVSDRMLEISAIRTGNYLKVDGEVRTYNAKDTVHTRLVMSIFVTDLSILDEPLAEDINQLNVTGYLCKRPQYRDTPLGREITDLLLAVNRPYGKSDYIPCICWGRNAKYAAIKEVGDLVKITGRFQSREYVKNDSVMTTYEVSINIIEYT